MIQAEIEYIYLKIGTVLNGTYEINEVVNKSELGISYVGYSLKDKRKIIIKEFYPDRLALRDMDGKTVVCKSTYLKEKYYNLKEFFLNEALILNKLNHKNIARCIDYFIENATAYIVIEYFEGKTLDKYIKENKDISIACFFKTIFIPLINTINWIHKKNIIHRDIKPSNIIINKNNEHIIIDFGSAINYKEYKNKKIFTTKGFSPIEFYSEKSIQGTYSDIYSFSAMLYYYLCDKVPIEAPKRIIEDNIEDIRNCNKQISLLLSKLIMKNLSINYKDRFSSVQILKTFMYFECIILKIKNIFKRQNV